MADTPTKNWTADAIGADPILRGEARQAARHGDRDAASALRDWEQRGRTPGPLADPDNGSADGSGNGSDGGEGTPDRRQVLAEAFQTAGAGRDPEKLAALADWYDADRLVDADGTPDLEAIGSILATTPEPRRPADLGQGRRSGQGRSDVHRGASLYEDLHGPRDA